MSTRSRFSASSDELGTLCVSEGERFFHEDMFAGLKRLHDHSSVLFGRGRDGDAIDCRIVQRLANLGSPPGISRKIRR